MKPQFDINKIKHKFNFDIRPVTNYSPRDIDKYYERNIDFDVLLSNGTPLQRSFVWTLLQKQSLIISMIKELVLPEFLVVVYRDYSQMNSDIKTCFRIIDGKQRLSTIYDFMDGKFPININDFDYFYNELDKSGQMAIWNYSMNFRTIYEYEDEKLSDADLIALFEYVNFTGTPQDADHIEKLKNSL